MNRQSVYLSARQVLPEGELEALKQFEECFLASLPEEEQSVYFDALEFQDDTQELCSGIPQQKQLPKQKLLDYAPCQIADPIPRASVSMKFPSSLLSTKELKDPKIKLNLQGYPGALTEAELEACQEFQKQLQIRADVATDNNNNKKDGTVYREMVRAFYPVEEEPYALCRFLRSRKFHVDHVFQMMEEGVQAWRNARKHNFFPDPSEAIGGAPLRVLLTQYPALYYGYGKNGAPVNYFRAGNVHMEGLECLTEIENMERYAWYTMYHQFKQQVAKAQETNPNAVRYAL